MLMIKCTKLKARSHRRTELADLQRHRSSERAHN